MPIPSLPTPVYLFLLSLAFLRSARIFSTSDNSPTSSRERLRTDQEQVSKVASSKVVSRRTIDALILALIIDVMEISEHFEG